ncbi:hypothetical protein DMZ43_11120 [Meridianimaribacter sp. CL38]|uniref:sulfotransferase family 2 domain-containing protein n=1 Tax=Meridianimaribacter sp. CL38 TaxID=2213021 RepID=UPI00103D86D9|nr:sulfotransferase family 2 domain-containing protein [Meridianimaribacter sp. CL38]TBV25490.1 hypothetical protein DMZ43_11120 [Meridianimaribacter sp. CL38]
MVSHKYKCIFIHIPKTGGETVISLIDDSDKSIPKHANAAQIRDYLGEDKWNEYYKFSIVRNPFDLAISMYSHLRKPLYEKENIIKKYGKSLLNPVNACETACNYSFSKYCEIVFDQAQIQEEESKKDWPVFHFKPQYDWLIDYQSSLIIDNIILFENYDLGLKGVMEDLGISKNTVIPKKNKSKHMHYSKYYTKKSYEIVQKHYSKDIEKFNYTFENKKSFLDEIKLKLIQ